MNLLSTRRLRLRPMSGADAPTFHRQWNHSEVGRFLWDGKPVALETVEAVIAASEASFARAGYGLWSLRLAPTPEKSAGRLGEPEPLGFSGLRVPEGQAHPEVLYALESSAWGHGYASEALTAVLRHAFLTLGLPRLTAGANPANPASWRVLERAGFRRTGLVHTEIEDLYAYELSSESHGRGT
jgi:RimJ/RimL family protein N-acetyltransferase